MRLFRVSEGYEDNLELRVEYMMNHINDEKFKKILQCREKRNEIKQEYRNILGMFVNCQTEIYFKIENVMDVHSHVMEVQMSELIDESNRLMEYTNECLKNISITYDIKKYYHFDERFRLLHGDRRR
jgi:hypothetical protein